eukprot:CAMPEP_0185307536 /NCGR_PEP_ID=MMETSP1363-20130426/16827_1 /TAXON_ID=38817 /ORGANISM="Gephyrocapsa oceanica, Strain RCC1303" /LENGTH=61 /DNA_ID=CAMNT_0027904861 /DNA_START=14 /DNA_END=195 /DNA_ORIENTATION=-
MVDGSGGGPPCRQLSHGGFASSISRVMCDRDWLCVAIQSHAEATSALVDGDNSPCEPVQLR